MNTAIVEFAQQVIKKYEGHQCLLPLKDESRKFIDKFLKLAFPQYSEKSFGIVEEIISSTVLLMYDLRKLLASVIDEKELVDSITDDFASTLPSIIRSLDMDAEAIYKGDPAARSTDEVILAYPGFYAITIYRIAHELFLLGVPVIPRILSEYAHEKTGIDIHPGAGIGERFCIDHGTGIVIGETTIIGNDVKIYQGVTLGALSVDKSFASIKRHPTIENNVVIYAQAVILGGNTVIGEKSVIGGNAWITESVPANSVVYHKSEVRLKQNGHHEPYLDFVI
ncbi:MAG: serine acetyltransferase [Ignavibacteriales bacterium]|nr:serine acetyltransferase [Ignavibacteriales bacterium]